jgi:hypothetical protein
MYIPDWGFVKRLKAYDDKLSVKWISCDPSGQLRNRWAIFRQQPAPCGLYDLQWLVMWVMGPGGTFRGLDERAIRILKMADTHRRGVDVIMDEADKANAALEDRETASYRSDMKEYAKETRHLLAAQAEEDFGAQNVPQEDVDQMLLDQYGEEALETHA